MPNFRLKSDPEKQSLLSERRNISNIGKWNDFQQNSSCESLIVLAFCVYPQNEKKKEKLYVSQIECRNTI